MTADNVADTNNEGTAQVIPINGALERGIDQIDRTLATGANLTLDFTGCNFISVDGLEWLEELMLRSDSLGSTVQLINFRPPVYKVFKVARIERLLKACGAPSMTMGPSC
jgi:anti-anti-sigma regulatory factor